MSKRVLIVRLSAVGDTILSLPIACALRRHMPDIELGWVVARGAADLITGHDCLDQVFVLHPEAMRSPSGLLTFIKTLRAWKPDVVIDAQGLTKSSVLGLLSGARRRIGHAKSEFEGRELSTWINNTIVAPTSSHVIDRGLELLGPLGIREPAIEFRIPDFPEIRAQVGYQAQAIGWSKPGAIINVGAGWPSKIWPNERYAAVARHLADRWNLATCVVWGGDREKGAADEVVALAEGAAVLAPPTTLPELAEWIRRSSLFLGSDTGPMHLACALDIPTVGLIGPMPVERVGPRGDRQVSVQRRTLDSTQRGHRKTECGPMRSIDAASVTAACDSLLQAIRYQSAA